jgi:hypothetical protein
MKRITEQQYQICKEHGLLYDGKNTYKGLNKKVEQSAYSGRTFVRTRHGIFLTEGSQGIYDMMLEFEKKGSDKVGNSK